MSFRSFLATIGLLAPLPTPAPVAVAVAVAEAPSKRGRGPARKRNYKVHPLSPRAFERFLSERPKPAVLQDLLALTGMSASCIRSYFISVGMKAGEKQYNRDHIIARLRHDGLTPDHTWLKTREAEELTGMSAHVMKKQAKPVLAYGRLFWREVDVQSIVELNNRNQMLPLPNCAVVTTSQ
jgi:hypothetical protein